MDAFLRQLHSFDRYRLSLAPLLGLLAGFLANRAHGGSTGWALLGEMILGAMMMTFGVTVLTNLSLLVRDRDREANIALQEQRRELQRRRQALIEAEARRHHTSRFVHEQLIRANRRAQRLEVELDRQRAEAESLREAVAGVQGGARAGRANQDLATMHVRLRRLEAESEFAREARERIDAIEKAQLALVRERGSAGEHTEADEVKASLLQLAITESTRARNVAGPDNDQSGRIIELEQRIKRLAREIETLSKRQPAVADDGKPSLVEPGGTADNTRIGFLKAMLDANKTIRKRIA